MDRVVDGMKVTLAKADQSNARDALRKAEMNKKIAKFNIAR